MELQTFYLYLPIFVTVLFALLVIGRYLFKCFSDLEVKEQLNRTEKLNSKARKETDRITDTVRECKQSAEKVRNRESEARKSVKCAESAIKTAREHNRAAEKIIGECFEIIEKAENNSNYFE